MSERNGIHIPEELLEQFERGNVLLFVGERITYNSEEQALVDYLTIQLAARCNIADEGPVSFPEAAQAYEDEKGRQALIQFLRDQDQGTDPQQAHRLIASLTDDYSFTAVLVDGNSARQHLQDALVKWGWKAR